MFAWLRSLRGRFEFNASEEELAEIAAGSPPRLERAVRDPSLRAMVESMAPQLRAFRYFPTVRDERDSLVAGFRIPSEAQLSEVESALGIQLCRVEGDWSDADALQEALSAAQTDAARAELLTSIPSRAYPGFARRTPSTLAHIRLDAILDTGLLKLVIEPDSGVGRGAFLDAQALEKRFAFASLEIVDPPGNHSYCVCPIHYPALFVRR